MASDVFPGGLRLSECEPKDWFLAFSPHASRPWIKWLVLGHYKHVSAFGFVERAQSWVFFDWNLDRSHIFVVGNHEADIMIGEYSTNHTVVRMARPIGQEKSVNFAVGGWCVPSVAHLVGLRSSALRPDALFRQCLAHGGQIIEPIGQGNEAENT